jgi:lycopene cyclase-like protein
MPNYHYSYLVGALIFDAAWLACYLLGKNYRAEIRWGTLISAPLALTSILFIPQYWSPPSLFDLDSKIKVGIEDFLWAAAVGGIASAIAEILLKERLSALRRVARKRHFAPFVVVVVVFVALELWQRDKTIYNCIIAFAIGVVVIAVLRSDLIPTMLIGALSFTALYFVLFLIVLQPYPEFVTRFYNIPHLLGIYVLKVPIEELLFAATGGAIWSVAYEYVQGYRLEPR